MNLPTVPLLSWVSLPASLEAGLRASPFGPFEIRRQPPLPPGEFPVVEAEEDPAGVAWPTLPLVLWPADIAMPAARLQELAYSCALVLVGEMTPAAVCAALQQGVQECWSAELLLQAEAPARLRASAERKRHELASRRAYATDLGTGLPHRQQLVEHMSHLLALRAREPGPMAVLVVHVGGLTVAESQFGREPANVLRRKVAVRLRAAVRASDVVAFLGQDRFALLLAALLSPDDAVGVGDKLRQALALPLQVAGQAVPLVAHLGIASYPQDGDQAEVLLQRAVNLASGAAGALDWSGGIRAEAANDAPAAPADPPHR